MNVPKPGDAAKKGAVSLFLLCISLTRGFFSALPAHWNPKDFRMLVFCGTIKPVANYCKQKEIYCLHRNNTIMTDMHNVE
jgi:hypothetical protein